MRPGEPRQFLSDYLLDNAPVPDYVKKMEAFDDSDERMARMEQKMKGAQAALDASAA